MQCGGLGVALAQTVRHTGKQTGNIMKSLYEIKNAKGIHLCYQVAETAAEAVHAAKVYYGHKSAAFADFVLVND